MVTETQQQNTQHNTQQSPQHNPKLVILTAVVVPLTVSFIGLLGVLLPNLIKNNVSTTETSNTPSQNNTSSEVDNIQETPENEVILEDAYGYLSRKEIISNINSEKITLKDEKSEDDFEIQLTNGKYYLVGYVKENATIESLLILSKKSEDFSKTIGIPFEEIVTIKESEVRIQKKENLNALEIKANSIILSVTVH